MSYQSEIGLVPTDTATGWTVLGNDTTTLAAAAKHVIDGASLEFDKVNGAANTKFAGAYYAPSIDLTSPALAQGVKPKWQLQWHVYVSATTNVDYSFLRLGTDSSNYNEWRYPDTSITAARFTRCTVNVGDTFCVGNGWDPSTIVYAAVGVAFDAETNTLADIAIARVAILPA